MFPNYNISVRQDTGTASGWKRIEVVTDRKLTYKINGLGFDRETVDFVNDISKKAEEIACKSGDVGSYLVDSGYSNDYNNQLLVSVKGI